MSKEKLCSILKEKLLYLEKYSTSKDKNKLTYVMIPKNHSFFPFPYNLEDRIKYNINYINKNINSNIEIIVKKNKDENNNIIYNISFKNKKDLESKSNLIKDFDFNLENNEWTKIIK